MSIETDLTYEGIATELFQFLFEFPPMDRNRPDIRRDCDFFASSFVFVDYNLHRNRPDIRRDCDPAHSPLGLSPNRVNRNRPDIRRDCDPGDRAALIAA